MQYIHFPERHHTPKPIWLIFLIGLLSTATYAVLIGIFLLFGNLPSGLVRWFADHWGEVSGVYIITQIVPIVSRPLSRDAWEAFDHISSFIPAALVILVAPIVWMVQGRWPTPDVWQIWWVSFFIVVADVLLTLVALKISRASQRFTPS